MNSKFFAQRKPRIFAHRGYSDSAPENSLAAFELGLQHTPYIETDLHSLNDGTLVFHHDADVFRSCGVRRNLSELNLADLKDLKLFGTDSRIPTVAEALHSFPDALWNIEIKDPRPQIENDVLALLKKTASLDRVLIAAEQDPIMHRFRAQQSGIPTSAAHDEMLGIMQWLLKGAREPIKIEARAFQLPTEFSGMRLDRPELLQIAHEFGIEIHYWTINDAAEARRLVKLGADGIVSDNPERMARALANQT